MGMVIPRAERAARTPHPAHLQEVAAVRALCAQAGHCPHAPGVWAVLLLPLPLLVQSGAGRNRLPTCLDVLRNGSTQQPGHRTGHIECHHPIPQERATCHCWASPMGSKQPRVGLGLSAFIPQTLKLLENPHSSGALKPLQPARGNLVPCVGPEQEGGDLRDLCRACCAWRTACPTLLAHPRQTRFLQLPSGGVIPECSREHIIIHLLARLGALFIENKNTLDA